MSNFTWQEVRDAAESGDSDQTTSAMLRAYAERLKEDEKPVPFSAADFHKAQRIAREGGRLEILREVARVAPWGGGMPIDIPACVFCGGREHETHPHGPDCLWRRAQEATK